MGAASSRTESDLAWTTSALDSPCGSADLREAMVTTMMTAAIKKELNRGRVTPFYEECLSELLMVYVVFIQDACQTVIVHWPPVPRNAKRNVVGSLVEAVEIRRPTESSDHACFETATDCSGALPFHSPARH